MGVVSHKAIRTLSDDEVSINYGVDLDLESNISADEMQSTDGEEEVQDTNGEEEVVIEDDDADNLNLAAMLRTNQSLTHLDIMRSGIVRGDSMVKGLSENTALEDLRISVDARGAHTLMTALAKVGDTIIRGCPHLKFLHLGEHSYGFLDSALLSPIRFQSFPSAMALGNMLASNATLTELSLGGAPYSHEEWAGIILPALAINHSLQKLDLAKCPRVEGGIVYDALLDLLDSNTSITHIDLSGTPLDSDGLTQIVEARIKTNNEYGAALRTHSSPYLMSLGVVWIPSCR